MHHELTSMRESTMSAREHDGPALGGERRYCVADVFSADPFGGNPVAVVVDAEGLNDEMMAAITRWTNLSETTFLLPATDPAADYRLRIFTPSTELGFAGHPTLGSCRAWLAAGGAPRVTGVVVQECGVGLIEVRVGDGDTLSFAAPPLLRAGSLDPALLDEIVGVLGIHRSAVVSAAHVDNGPGWVGILLSSAAEVLAVELADSVHAIGVIGPHAQGSDAAYEVRAFFPEGRRSIEDPVTGSLNASLAQWLLAEGRVTAPFRVTQGGRLSRTGSIEIDADGSGQVWVGGVTTVRVSGTIDDSR